MAPGLHLLGLVEAGYRYGWVALSESNKANGALEVVPGTHLQDQVALEMFSRNNMLTRDRKLPWTSIRNRL